MANVVQYSVVYGLPDVPDRPLHISWRYDLMSPWCIFVGGEDPNLPPGYLLFVDVHCLKVTKVNGTLSQLNLNHRNIKCNQYLWDWIKVSNRSLSNFIWIFHYWCLDVFTPAKALKQNLPAHHYQNNDRSVCINISDIKNKLQNKCKGKKGKIKSIYVINTSNISKLVLSGNSAFLPQAKDMHGRFICNSKLSSGASMDGCSSLCVGPAISWQLIQSAHRMGYAPAYSRPWVQDKWWYMDRHLYTVTVINFLV